MDATSQNPFAAPREDVEDDLRINTSPPLSMYGYVFVVFCLGAFCAGVATQPLFLLLPSVPSFLFCTIASIGLGAFSANNMYQRLAKIHRKKVVWEMEQAERVNQYLEMHVGSVLEADG